MGIEHDALLYKSPNPKHPCAVWVESSKAHFRWALRHARELHEIYNTHMRKRCPTCQNFISPPHLSLGRLEFLEKLESQNELPASMPEHAEAENVYAKLENIRARQAPKAKETAGPILRATAGLPEGCSSIALAINGYYQSIDGCIVYDENGSVNGVKTYCAYHQLKTPDAPLASQLPWLADDYAPVYDCARSSLMCSCSKKRRRPRLDGYDIDQCPRGQSARVQKTN